MAVYNTSHIHTYATLYTKVTRVYRYGYTNLVYVYVTCSTCMYVCGIHVVVVGIPTVVLVRTICTRYIGIILVSGITSTAVLLVESNRVPVPLAVVS